MLGQATSILTSTVGAGIITGHRKTMQAERASQGMREMGMGEINNDAFTASVTMILNGVNSFLYQIVLLPLYTMIALQKTMVCTANDIFGIFDATGFTIRVGRADLQQASDVSSGVCLSAFFESQVSSSSSTRTHSTAHTDVRIGTCTARALTTFLRMQVNAITERGTPASLSQAANDILRDAGQSASSFIVAGSTGSGQGSRSANVLALLGGPKVDGSASGSGTGSRKVPDAVSNAGRQRGGKTKTMFEKFKNIKIVDRLGGMMGKLQLKAPIHLIDSMITYAIGVISGMQDMAQVRVCFSVFNR
jgi:hypothetical protein